MQLRLSSNRVQELHILPVDVKVKNAINFRYSSVQSPGSNTEFTLTFDFTLTSARGFELKLIHNFSFETDTVLDTKFWEGSFHKINAPAIAYPYLRAFVSTILLNAGLEAVVLPSVNFVEMSKKQSKEIESI
ncbi:protein-export chaperone SecB [Yersinia enterocolitica]